jgi:hypothetical protein
LKSLIDLIQTIARQRGRGDTTPLSMLRQLDGVTGERISHLPTDTDLSQAWLALTGEPFRPHQAQALTALRRGEPVALCADSPSVAATARLLLYAALQAEPTSAALIIAPDADAAADMHTALSQVNANLPHQLRLSVALVEPRGRPNATVRVLICTSDDLHNRLLRHHDRAWSLLWPRMRLLLTPELQRYAGVAGAHLADLLLRTQRLALYHYGQAPALLATAITLDDPQPALTGLLGQPWRIVGGDDVPCESVTLTVWQHGDRLRDAADVAQAIQREGFHVHIVCRPIEKAILLPMIGDTEDITIGPHVMPAHAIIAAGYPGSYSALKRLLRSGAQALVLTLGEQPHEQLIARYTESLLQEPASVWPEPPTNAYVTAQHILCAATELPLTEAEIDTWGAQDIVTRLVAHNQLVDLPDPEVAWKPTSQAGDPYAEFSLLSSSGGAIVVRNEQGHTLDLLDPTGFERWTFPGAALPPGCGGMRVIQRDEAAGSVTVRIETNRRRTYPLRRCDVTVREERETQALFGTKRISLGRVVVEEETYGYREAIPTGAPAEVALKEPLAARWIAPACWFDLPSDLQVSGQFIGWSLAGAIDLRTLAAFTDIVPCYDPKTRRLYMIDAQPGGNGAAAWIYKRAEALLPIAYDIAYTCRNDLLLEPLARVDMDWLLALLGQRANLSAERERIANERKRSDPKQTEYIAGPPPAPRILLTPPLPDERRPVAPAPARDERAGPRRDEPARPPRAETPAPWARTPADAVPPPRRDEPARPPREEPPRRSGRDQQGGLGQSELPSFDAPPPPASRKSNHTTAPRERTHDKRNAPPNRPTPPGNATPPDDDKTPDPDALIARLRQRRQQEEARLRSLQPQQRAKSNDDTHVEPRFAAGDHIFCLPYGDGVVRSSQIENGRELLVVTFPTYGELTIDPAISLVRKTEEAKGDEDDLL